MCPHVKLRVSRACVSQHVDTCMCQLQMWREDRSCQGAGTCKFTCVHTVCHAHVSADIWTHEDVHVSTCKNMRWAHVHLNMCPHAHLHVDTRSCYVWRAKIRLQRVDTARLACVQCMCHATCVHMQFCVCPHVAFTCVMSMC